MKKAVLAAIAAVILAMGGWYWLSPSLAMKGLKDAALVGDKEELRDRVDFPAIRESLKSQMRAAMVAEMSKSENQGFAALGLAFAGAIIDPMIDGMVSPEGIKAMVENGKLKTPKQGAETGADDKGVDWKIDRRGLDRFIATPKVKDGDKAPSLVFKRDGLGWDLVDVEVAASAASKDVP